MGSTPRKILSDGSVRYYARYKDPAGRWRWEAAGKRKKDALALLRRREAEVINGTYGKQEEISFSAFADKWLKDYAAHKVKEKTLRDYHAIIKNHLKPYFGRDLLGQIGPGKVQGFVAAKMEQDKDPEKKERKLAPTTVIKMVVVLKEMFEHAVKWGYLKENPARFVERPRPKRMEMDYLRPEEIRRLLDAASPGYYALFCTAILTGMRQGELLGLKWGDIDLQSARIHVRRTYTEGKYSDPKPARSTRTVAITPFLADVLRHHKTVSASDPDKPVFANSAGGPLDAPNMVKREFEPALERAGLRRIRFHDLRHTYAALMISIGENMKFIQHQMGHASITTTIDRYGHLLPEVSHGMGERLDRAVFGEKVTSISEAKRQASDLQ